MAAMHRRLAKELPMLRAKTLVNDGMAVEAGSEDACASAAASAAAVVATSQRHDINASVARRGESKAPKSPGGPAVSFIALLAGPRDSPYEGGVFRLQVDVSPQYPMEPPKIKFVTQIFHPNVGRGHTPGAICLDILRKEAWSPALTIERTLLSIASLVADPNPASPMDSEAAQLYTRDRPSYDKRVREWVSLYARPKAGSAASASIGAWAGHIGKDEPAPAAAPAQAPTRQEPTSSLDAQTETAAPRLRPGPLKRSVVAADATAAVRAMSEVVIDLSDSEDDVPATKRAKQD